MEFVSQSNFRYSRKEFLRNKAAIKLEIKKSIGRYFWGDEAGFRIGQSIDNQFKQALAYFDEAERLLDPKNY